MPPKNTDAPRSRHRAPKDVELAIEPESAETVNAYAPFRTVMLMKNLILFLIQEQYDFPLPERPS